MFTPCLAYCVEARGKDPQSQAHAVEEVAVPVFEKLCQERVPAATSAKAQPLAEAKVEDGTEQWPPDVLDTSPQGCARLGGLTVPPCQEIGGSQGTGGSSSSVSSPPAVRGTPLVTKLLDPSLLRGVSLATLLGGMGAHLRVVNLAATSFTEAESARMYATSRQVDRLHRFISHTWADSRVSKLLALSLSENQLGTIAASTLVAFVLLVLRCQGLLPGVRIPRGAYGGEYEHAPYCLFSGTITMFIALFYWHYIPSAVGCKKVYFLDKLCVHQTDGRLKLPGILSIAAFIAKADKLILLWTPRYFTRLWCMLEIAALVRVHDTQRLPLVFLPLQLANISFCAYIVLAASQVLYEINRLSGSVLPMFSIVLVLIVLGTFPLTVCLRAYARERKALREQLSVFSAEELECFSRRDRQLVFGSLIQWFGSLELFNDYVRSNLQRKILAALGSEVVFPLSYHAPLLLLFIFKEMDFIASGYWAQVPEDRILQEACMSIGWAPVLLTYMPVGLRLANLAAKKYEPRWKDHAMSAIVSALNLIYGVLAYAVANVFLPMCPSYIIVPGLVLLWLWALWLELGAVVGARCL